MALRTRVVGGAAWNSGLALANKVVTGIGQFLLAYLLAPNELGLASIAQSLAATVAVLSVGGIGDVLVQRGRLREEAGQALWLSLSFVVVTSSTAILAALLEPNAGDERVVGLVVVLALGTLVGFPNTVADAVLREKLAFKRLAFANFVTGSVGTTLTVLFAWLGLGAYSLVLPVPFKLGLNLALMLRHGGRFPLAYPNLKILKSLLRGSLMLSLTGLLTGLRSHGPVLVLGMLIGSAATGLFSWAWAMAGQAVFLLAGAIRNVLLPALVSVPNEQGRRESAALRAAWAMTAVLTLACGVQAIVAEPLIVRLLPSKWHAAGPLIGIVSFGLVGQGFWIAGSALLNAQGRYRTLFWLTSTQTVLVIGGTAATARSGSVDLVTMACAGGSLIGCLLFAPCLLARDSWRELARPLSAVAVCSFAWTGAAWIGNAVGGLTGPLLAGSLFALAATAAWATMGGAELRKIVKDALSRLL